MSLPNIVGPRAVLARRATTIISCSAYMPHWMHTHQLCNNTCKPELAIATQYRLQPQTVLASEAWLTRAMQYREAHQRDYTYGACTFELLLGTHSSSPKLCSLEKDLPIVASHWAHRTCIVVLLAENTGLAIQTSHAQQMKHHLCCMVAICCYASGCKVWLRACSGLN